MNPAIEAQLTQDAIKLNKLNRLVVKAVVEWNTDELFKSLQEYVNVKEKIKTVLIDHPIVRVHDHTAQDVLKKLSQGEPLQADNLIRILEAQSDESVSLDGLNDSEIEELGLDLFYSQYICLF